jgi:hypothetical protein
VQRGSASNLPLIGIISAEMGFQNSRFSRHDELIQTPGHNPFNEETNPVAEAHPQEPISSWSPDNDDRLELKQ